MNELQVFQNNDFGHVRIILIDGEPWFVGKDVADALGYEQTNSMVKRLDDEDFISSKLEGMNMKSILINESGLYAAILGSNLSTAKKFKRWVTSEVLPSIRKQGSYAVGQVIPNPEELLLKALQKIENKNDILYTVSEVAKIIKTNPGYVYKLIKAGHLEILKLGSCKIRKSTLESFLEKYEGYDLTNPYDIKKIEL
jgi:excisionase family DNA binding protein